MRQRTRCFIVTNWERYQHYQNRYPPPPWIKLHSRILEDHEFCALEEGAQLLAVKLMLMASKVSNHVPAAEDWVARQTGLTTAVVLARLETLLTEQYIAPCGCETCQSLPPIVWLELHSRPALDPTHARARVSLSSESLLSGSRGGGAGGGVEIVPLPDDLGAIEVDPALLADTPDLAHLETMGDLWAARLGSPNLKRQPSRADQQAQAAALGRAITRYGRAATVELAVRATVNGWARITDQLVDDQLGTARNGHHPKTSTSKRRAEAQAGIDPAKLQQHGVTT